MLPDDLIEQGTLIYRCPRCGQEVLDDFELMEVHMSQCGVSCRTCADTKSRVLDKTKNCYYCNGYKKWMRRD